MKTKILVLCIAAMAATAILLSGSMQQSPDQLYQSAIYKEDVEGQLEEAIDIYRQIIEKFPNDGPAAAKAWFHMGLCYEKLGNQEAQKAYQHVLANYADQKEIASQARARLAVLVKAAKAVASAPKFRQIEIPGKPPIRSAAMLSPDGTRFAFLAEGDIWTVPVSGGVHPNIAGEPVRLTKNMNAWEAGNCTVTWSTDGQWIAFRVRPDHSVYLVPASGGEPRRVDGIGPAPGGAQTSRISVSQAGDRVVFPKAGSGLAIIPTTGGQATLLAPGPAYEPAFSPNGKLIAYIKGERTENGLFQSIMVVPADGGESILVSSMPGTDYMTNSPTWSPDGKMIAFPVQGGESPELWIVPVSSNGRPEAEPTKFDLKPIAEAKLRGKSVFKFMDPLGGWSRKNEIALLLEKPEDSAIYRVPASGGRATLIGLDGRTPRWSPDGKRIYFRGRTNIESVAAEGGDERSVPIRYKTPLNVWFPAGSNEVSKDGRDIVFAGGGKGESGIYRVPSQGGEAKPIAIPVSGYAVSPSWSPDGKWIAYRITTESDNSICIWISPSEGGEAKQLTSDADQVGEGEVRWSPDGKTIAYFGADKTLRLIPSTGGSSRVLTQVPAEDILMLKLYGLSWSPDGSKLAYTTFERVWVIPASGGEPQEIPVGFDGSRIMQIDWSPDGKTLAFTGVSGAEEEVWLMSDFLHLVKSGENLMAQQSAREDEPLGFATRRVWEGSDGVFSNAASPDGRYITYVDWESGNLGIRDLEANTSRLLTNEGTWEEPTQTVYSSRWSPDGKQIAYHWYKGSEAQLRVVSLDDPQPRILFKSEGAWLDLQDWSPDGENILAQISGTGQPGLALVPVKGGSPKVIKTSVEGGLFSPDGRYIAYGRTPGKVAALDIFVMDANGSGEIPLVQHPADDSLFGWSPDGKWILFLSDRSGTLDFWAIGVMNGKPQGAPVRVKRSVGRVTSLGFAKDGSFYYADVKVARDIITTKIDFQTGKVLEPIKKAITQFEGSNMNPCYSPDGKWLAHTSRRGSMVFPTNSANALCMHSLESGTERVFMDEFVNLGVSSVAGPRWAPDSRSVVVAGLKVVGSGRSLYQVNLETGEVNPVVVLAPEVKLLNHEFSTDSQHLYYVQEDSNRKLCQILKRDLRTGEEREIYQTSSGDEEPRGIALSPDGKRLAIMSYDRRTVSVMPSSGGTPRVVHRFDQPRNTNPEWTRKGRYVLIRSVGGPGILSLIPMDGGQIHEIALQNSFSDRITAHPDGQQIAFTIQFNADSDAEVWVMRNFLPK